MKRENKMKGFGVRRAVRALAVAVVAAVLTTSCSNMVERMEIEQPVPVVDTANQGEQRAYLSLSASLEGQGRTVMPSLELKEDTGLTVSLLGKQGADGAENIIKSWSADGKKDAFTLMREDTAVVVPALGEWTFRLVATRDEVVVVQSTTEVTITVAKGNNALDFGILGYVSGSANTAPGLVQLCLSYPENSGVAAAKGGLFNLDYGAIEGFELKPATVAGATTTYSAEGVKEGVYLVEIRLYRDVAATNQMYTYTEVVHVKSGVMSRAERSLTDVNKDERVRVTLDLLGGQWADGKEYFSVKKGSTVADLPIPVRPDGTSGTFGFWTDKDGVRLAATHKFDTDGTVVIAAWKDMSAADAATAWPKGTDRRTYTLALTGPVTTQNTMDGLGTALDTKDNAFAILDLSKLEMTSFCSLGDDKMVEVVLPDTLTSITGTSGNPPFVGSALRSITIPAGITSIPASSFRNSPNLTKFVVVEGNPSYTTVAEGRGLLGKDGTLVAWPTAVGDIVIPEGVTSIGENTFRACTKLTSVNIPSSVERIGLEAFYDCTNLTIVTFAAGSKLLSIDQNAFYRCTKLDSIDLPVGVTSIGNYAFYKCTGLTSVEIPSSVERIGLAAFRACTNLTSVKILGPVTDLSSVFAECANLESVELPGTVTSVYTNYTPYSCFRGCSKLTHFVVTPVEGEESNLKASDDGTYLYRTTSSGGKELVAYPSAQSLVLTSEWASIYFTDTLIDVKELTITKDYKGSIPYFHSGTTDYIKYYNMKLTTINYEGTEDELRNKLYGTSVFSEYDALIEAGITINCNYTIN